MANDPAMLQAALVGYQQQLEEIDRAIADLRKRLGGRGGATIATASSGSRRQLSPAARKRIAAAQKKRWAAYRKQKAK